MTDGTRPRTRRPVVAMAPGSDRVLAAEMLLPLDRESRRVIIPGDRYGLRWSPYTVELFGLTRTDDATSPSPTGVLYVQRADDEALAPRPANWPSLETAYGHIHARRRLDPSTLVLEVWQQIVRCRGCSSFLEWRFRAEAFDQLSLRGLQREERLSDAHKVLRGRALIRQEPLGRPSGSQLTEDELWERVPGIADRLRLAGVRVSYRTVAPELSTSESVLKRAVTRLGIDWKELTRPRRKLRH